MITSDISSQFSLKKTGALYDFLLPCSIESNWEHWGDKWGFGSCTYVDEVLVLPGCDAMSLGIWFLVFWDSIVGLIFEAQEVLMTLWPLKGRPLHCVDTLGTKYPVTQCHIWELIPNYRDNLWRWRIGLALVLAVLNLPFLLPRFLLLGWLNRVPLPQLAFVTWHICNPHFFIHMNAENKQVSCEVLPSFRNGV